MSAPRLRSSSPPPELPHSPASNPERNRGAPPAPLVLWIAADAHAEEHEQENEANACEGLRDGNTTPRHGHGQDVVARRRIVKVDRRGVAAPCIPQPVGVSVDPTRRVMQRLVGVPTHAPLPTTTKPRGGRGIAWVAIPKRIPWRGATCKVTSLIVTVVEHARGTRRKVAGPAGDWRNPPVQPSVIMISLAS